MSNILCRYWSTAAGASELMKPVKTLKTKSVLAAALGLQETTRRMFGEIQIPCCYCDPGRRGEGTPTRFVHYDTPVTVARAVWVNQSLERRSVLPLCYNNNDPMTSKSALLVKKCR